MKQASSTNIAVTSLIFVRGAICATLLATHLAITLASGITIGFTFRLLGMPATGMDLNSARGGLGQALGQVLQVSGLTNHGGRA